MAYLFEFHGRLKSIILTSTDLSTGQIIEIPFKVKKKLLLIRSLATNIFWHNNAELWFDCRSRSQKENLSCIHVNSRFMRAMVFTLYNWENWNWKKGFRDSVPGILLLYASFLAQLQVNLFGQDVLNVAITNFSKTILTTWLMPAIMLCFSCSLELTGLRTVPATHHAKYTKESWCQLRSLESQTVSHYFGDLHPQCFCDIITGVSDSELTSGHPNGHLL